VSVAAEASLEQVRIDVVVVDDDALLYPHGELDMFSVDQLRAALTQVDEVPNLTVDLQDVTFVDSAVLRCFAAEARARITTGRRLRIDNPHGIVRRLMDLLRLDDLRAT